MSYGSVSALQQEAVLVPVSICPSTPSPKLSYCLHRICRCIEGGGDAVLLVRGLPQRHAQQRGGQGGGEQCGAHWLGNTCCHCLDIFPASFHWTGTKVPIDALVYTFGMTSTEPYMLAMPVMVMAVERSAGRGSWATHSATAWTSSQLTSTGQ